MTAIALANHSAFGGKGTLALTNLNSTDFDLTSPYFAQAGVRVLTDGDVQELLATGSWSDQNPTTEWIDGFKSDVASDYEVQLAYSSGTGTLSGPTLSTYHTISTTRQWTLTRTTVGSNLWVGTMTIREIANTSNSVSATVTLSVECDTGL